MIFPILGTIMGLMFAAVPLWKAFQGPPSKRAHGVTPDPKSQTPDPKPSEARQLAGKARSLIDAIDSTADDFAAAESLIKRALELDATDGEVWAVSSRINSSFLGRGFERSATRRETARSQAERAVKLAPNLPEAWLALGRGIGVTDAVRAEEALRHGLGLAPENGRLLLGLASIYRQSNRFDEALAIYERAAAQPESRALARYDQYLIHFYSRRFAEADRCLRESISVSKSSIMVAGLALLDVTWRGDVAQAQRVLADTSTGLRGQTRVVLAGVLVSLMAGQPDEALLAFDRLPADYVNDAWYTGPKALLVGLAHFQAGRQEAARIAWESGLAVVRRRLQEAPNDLELHLRLGELLAWTGQAEAALQEARIFNELQRGRSTDWTYSSVRIHAALGRVDDALPLLEQLLAAPSSNRWPLTPALLRIDPLWTKLRGDPRFQQLLTRTETAERTALPPRDWPKDPELKKAFTIITGIDATAESCRLAEDMVNAVLRQRPTDVEATVVYATLNNYYMNRGYDLSTEREVLARRYAERALQLAPDEPEALAAMAQFLGFRQTDFPRAEQLIRRAMELAPHEPRFGRILSYNILRVTRPADALAQARENVVRFPHDALTQYDLALIARSTGDVSLMEEALDRTIALTPLGSAMVWKGWLTGWVHGDLPGFKSWLDRISGNFRFNERAVFMRYVYACLTGDAAYGLEAVQAFTGTWMNDFYYIGPRSLLLGDLLALQGQSDLAREQYERALAEIRRVAAAQPDDMDWRPAEFWTLVGLGRTDEARQAAQRQLGTLRRPYRPVYNVWWHNPITVQLLAGNRSAALALIREAAAVPIVRDQIRTALRIDPRMAPFRGDPEIQALLAEPEKK